MPYPPNYGGVIDVYYKLWWLHQAGVKVHLHCFTYGREKSKQLSELCATVHYYKRRTGMMSNLSLLPYTVVSRRSSELRRNLLANDYPILFEVLNTCSLMADPELAHRMKVYRHSNIEHKYYHAIAASERSIFRKTFHHLEALRLRLFERVVKKAQLILAVNEKDAAYFTAKYPDVPCRYLPSFHSHRRVEVSGGRGSYALFHGNLSIAENYNAALWLVRNVLSQSEFPAVIAGLNPPGFLREEISRHPGITLVADPPQEKMDTLIREAQVHLLYTQQETGLKLKLLNVLFSGRIILCNQAMLAGTGILSGSGIMVAGTAAEFRESLEIGMKTEIGEQLLAARRMQVARFSNQSNVEKLIELVFRMKK